MDSRSECLAPLALLGRGAGGEGQSTFGLSLQFSGVPKGSRFFADGEGQLPRKAQ